MFNGLDMLSYEADVILEHQCFHTDLRVTVGLTHKMLVAGIERL